MRFSDNCQNRRMILLAIKGYMPMPYKDKVRIIDFNLKEESDECDEESNYEEGFDHEESNEESDEGSDKETNKSNEGSDEESNEGYDHEESDVEPDEGSDEESDEGCDERYDKVGKKWQGLEVYCAPQSENK
ncbi:hypothetical protein Tsubulata_021954 [Turnera subulata]|uniref:Uncharacterized protein n=1 Tax=Turnera subulata TaxID=218843 RepID=A0A9Q0FF36_9ROSI|nr:hypothetical protein Tsubulata_021954 [Turnera subulata]